MISEELQVQMLELSQQLSHALNEHRSAGEEHARAEHAYRLARAKAYTEYATDGNKRTVDHLNAMVDLKCDNQMLLVRLAEAKRESTTELVRSLRTQISALQSMLGAHRAEAEAVRFGQNVAAA